MILDMLGKRDMSVGEMAESLGVPPATVSQHLRLLRDKNLVITRKDGQTVFYSLALPRMTEACHLLREILLDSMKKRGQLARDLDVDNLIEDVASAKAAGAA
jgi:ArsR family transcriptional regulator